MFKKFHLLEKWIKVYIFFLRMLHFITVQNFYCWIWVWRWYSLLVKQYRTTAWPIWNDWHVLFNNGLCRKDSSYHASIMIPMLYNLHQCIGFKELDVLQLKRKYTTTKTVWHTKDNKSSELQKLLWKKQQVKNFCKALK